MSLVDEPSKKLPTRQVCRRYNVSDRTVARWENNPALGFPQAIKINKRKYFDETELTQFDRAQAARR